LSRGDRAADSWPSPGWNAGAPNPDHARPPELEVGKFERPRRLRLLEGSAMHYERDQCPRGPPRGPPFQSTSSGVGRRLLEKPEGSSILSGPQGAEKISDNGQDDRLAARQRRRAQVGHSAVDDAARRTASLSRSHGNQKGLRPRPMRRLYRAGRW